MGEAIKINLTALNNNRLLRDINWIGIVDGKIDLRGAVLSVVKAQRTIGTKEHSLTQTFGLLKPKHVEFENIDFSHADLSYAIIRECSFINCLFNGTNAKEIEIHASDFGDCVFERADFSYAYLNRNIGANAGSFKNCTFKGGNIKGSDIFLSDH